MVKKIKVILTEKFDELTTEGQKKTFANIGAAINKREANADDAAYKQRQEEIDKQFDKNKPWFSFWGSKGGKKKTNKKKTNKKRKTKYRR